MKALLLCTLFLFASGTIADAKRFQVTYSVTFNSLTLEQAAKKEAMFRELFTDACKIDVKVEEVGRYGIGRTYPYLMDSLLILGKQSWIPYPLIDTLRSGHIQLPSPDLSLDSSMIVGRPRWSPPSGLTLDSLRDRLGWIVDTIGMYSIRPSF